MGEDEPAWTEGFTSGAMPDVVATESAILDHFEAELLSQEISEGRHSPDRVLHALMSGDAEVLDAFEAGDGGKMEILFDEGATALQLPRGTAYISRHGALVGSLFL